MTVLATIQRVSAKIGVGRPIAVFSSDEREHSELAECANEVAELVAKSHDWQVLKRQQTFTGNGVTTGFPLPDAYDRMPKSQAVYTSRLDCPLMHVSGHDDWLDMTLREYTLATGSWTLIGGRVEFYPVLENAETASFYYMTDLTVVDENNVQKSAFTADTDEFRLPERLLRLGMIWKWKADKGLPADAHYATFMQAMSEEQAADGGSRVIRVGKAWRFPDARVAYPRAITP